MRIGFNPEKDKEIRKTKFWHQLIVPVYIPNQEGYFQNAFRILKKCLASIFETTHAQTFLSVVNNGSCTEIREYLTTLKEDGKIHELIHTSNIGKMNAIYKGLIGHDFSFVTIADADTLFLAGWQKETIRIFEYFPKAGAVGLVPQFNMFSNFCTNVLFDNFFNKKMRFRPVEQPLEMRKFYESLGRKMEEDHLYLKSMLSLESEGIKACIGSSHFVATYRKEVFTNTEKYIPSKMGNNSESLLDKAAIRMDLWKLTTFKNHAYHMGNVYEDWMDEIKIDQEELNPLHFPLNTATIKKPFYANNFIKNKLFKKALCVHQLNKLFFKFKKLSKNELKEYPRIYY